MAGRRTPSNGPAERASSLEWTIEDPMRGVVFGPNSAVPFQVVTGPKHSFDQEAEVSPITGGLLTSSPGSTPPGFSPRDFTRMAAFDPSRQDLTLVEASGAATRSNRLPKLAAQNSPAPWVPRLGTGPPFAALSASSIYADFAENPFQVSPLTRPAYGRGTATEGIEPGYFDDERRPSAASVNTADSHGSQSSTGRGIHRRLQAFFGEEYRDRPSAQVFEPGDIGAGQSGRNSMQSHHRNNSVATTSTADGKMNSPSPRPRSPMPSSDVAPWVYQESEDIPVYGNPPIRQVPAGPDKQRYIAELEAPGPPHALSAQSLHPHKLHLPGHRHSRSKDEYSKPPLKEAVRDNLYRPATSRENSSVGLKRLPDLPPAAMNTGTLPLIRPLSPPPNQSNGTPRDAPPYQAGLNGAPRDLPPPQPRQPGSAPKRSFLDKFKKASRHKEDADTPTKNASGSSRVPTEPHARTANGKAAKPHSSATHYVRRRDGSTSSLDGPQARMFEFGLLDPMDFRRDASGKVHSGHARSKRSRHGSTGKDPNRNSADPGADSALFRLDTDLNDMEGIVRQPPPLTPVDGSIFAGYIVGDPPGKMIEEVIGGAVNAADWKPPQSWAVTNPGDENMTRLREVDESGVPSTEADDGLPYCVRIFRTDSTFATLSTNLNSTVEELLRQLGRKSFLQDDLKNYEIVLRKRDLQRILEKNERPIAIQKRLLEQAGYTEADRLDEIGREDNSYLCRFTFVPTRLGGVYSFEKDPGFGKMQKFSHVDLQGRNLITIPITLHQKSTEIISLNLSRNLSLHVPADFIQSCINLREIKYTGNEAWTIPPCISLASRLTYLDISNNRLEQLDTAELEKIHGLLSIKMANNKMTSIPAYFRRFSSLRILNVSSNFLAQLPDVCCELLSLVDLDISFNSISSIPSAIGQLQSLERLLATNNRLSGSLPDAFGQLENLREVDIRFNAISSVELFSHFPHLEQFMAGHNSISVFEGRFPKLRTLHLNHNPVTRFGLAQVVPTLTSLTLSDAKLAQLPDDVFEKMPNLEKLILDKNHFATLSSHVGKLRRLEHLSLAKNSLSSLPAEIGSLCNLRFLDVRENNLRKLPSEIWYAGKLETLNVSSNVLEAFPKPGAAAPILAGDIVESPTAAPMTPVMVTTAANGSPSLDELVRLEAATNRRPSQGGLLGVVSTPGANLRSDSIVSVYGPGGRKASVISRTFSEGIMTPLPRKDSGFSNRIAATFASSLKYLYLADNRLVDDIFNELTLLTELRILNISYNVLDEIPTGSLVRWPHLTELYVSGNDLTSLPSDDFQRQSLLKVLHINGNKFQVLPAELGKLDKLAVLDCGSNALKYNVSNWPYDWNWNYNPNLKYLNLSGNRKLEIKPSQSSIHNRDGRDLTDFSPLHHLRVLGLMDVTLMVSSVPDETEDRRVRTSGSYAGSMTYGMADTLGRNEHLSTIDMVVPKFGGHEAETLLGMFDGQALSSGGSKVAKFLHENFSYYFSDEMSRCRKGSETPVDALRRTFLGLNKELATAANQALEGTPPHIAHRGSVSSLALNHEDANSGGVATVMFLQGMELYVANVGDAQAMLIHCEGGHRIITRKHHPADPSERQRIRTAGGYVSRTGKLNDVLDVSRAFGYIQHMPAVQAAPHIAQISLTEQDEMILIASRELWEYLTPDFVVDVARSERGDLMRASQKLRDLAMAFGATSKIMVMILGVSDIKLRERQRYRAQSLSMGPSGLIDDQFFPSKRPRRNKDGPDDSVLSRLDQEVDAPTGDVSMVFTDIKNSTLLWETYPMSMRAAIRQHNTLMRRQLRIIGGYEVKTEGDAFMVSFPTATSALLWCFTVQSQLLEIEWPAEILNSVHGQEVLDTDGNVIFRGLSVRIGIHWGAPVCEPDPVTRRMDYFGPIVNRAARISSVADGGQITVSSDFIGEIQRVLETYQEVDRSGSSGSEDALSNDIMGQAIRHELRLLSLQGFEVKELGEKRLKGLENPEYVYLVYPHSLAGRLAVQQQRSLEVEASSSLDAAAMPASAPLGRSSQQLSIDTDVVWRLWSLTLRLEMLCSTLEDRGSRALKAPETALLEKMRSRGGEVTDRFLLNFVEHQVSRVETCSTTLYLRHLAHPFGSVRSLLDTARPMGEILDSTDACLARMREVDAKEERLRAIALGLGIVLDDL
ncbi:MAG: cysteinyl-tRNA synthetase [Phylliscum demangeonii]|nr:MAG: cysteinyl-tRNA synthetase [Phylliscum demangeonii]